AGHLEQAVRERRLAVVDVRDDAEIAYVRVDTLRACAMRHIRVRSSEMERSTFVAVDNRSGLPLERSTFVAVDLYGRPSRQPATEPPLASHQRLGFSLS